MFKHALTQPVVPLVVVWVLVGCYNPVNQITADRYQQACGQAYAAGRFAVAEEACQRALINVRIGHLGSKAESEALYNLGLVKRWLNKFDEAEELYRAALKIEETVSPLDETKIGRRLAQLAELLAQTSRFKEAWPLLERLMPIATTYAAPERADLKMLFAVYAEQYRKIGLMREAALLEDKAEAL
jgi:tetratricopeptide (TPR) repeat protein